MRGQACCRDEGAGCGCAKIPVFFSQTSQNVTVKVRVDRSVVTVFVNGFSNFFNSFFRFAGAWSP
jgi:hypothetical protein